MEMNYQIALYCKSYRTDVKRTLRLAQSIDKFNLDNIPFYVSVPACDIELFTEYLKGCSVKIIEDESIIKSNPKIALDKVQALHGGTSQQIIKSEFWRLGLSESYVCLDSDSMFIRPFGIKDFLIDDKNPYTVLDEAHEILDAALTTRNQRVLDNFFRECKQFQMIFGRSGRNYSFGPNPPIWSRRVWQSLDVEYLTPNGMSFYDAIMKAPLDLNWYGEALLRYKAIPLNPCQPLFKVYHYAWQLDRDVRKKIRHEDLAQIYAGVIYQSAWDREMDWPRENGSFLSKVARRLRRKLGRS
jgi:hypothetical protein